MKRFTWLLMAILTLMSVAACVGLTNTAELRTETFSAALDGAERAEINITTNAQAMTVGTLDADSDLLISGEVDVIGELEFEVSGESVRRVSLSEQTGGGVFTVDGPLVWTVDVSPSLAVALDYTSNSGSATLNLGDMRLSALSLNLNSGDITANLPGTERDYDVVVDTNSGDMVLNFGARTSGTITGEVNSGSLAFNYTEPVNHTVTLDINSGTATFDIPDGAAVRVTVASMNSGTFNARLDGLSRVSGSGDEGVWQTAEYDAAAIQMDITVSVNSGTVTVE